MRIRVWRSWCVQKVYWGRVAALALGCGVAAVLLGGDPPEARAGDAGWEPAAVEASTPLSASTPLPAFCVSSHAGVFRSQGGELVQVWPGVAYDTLAVGETSFVSARYEDRVVWAYEGQELASFPAAGPVDCELQGETLIVVANGSGELLGIDLETHEVSWRLGGFSNHYDVALTPEGGFAVADSGNGRVVEFDANREQIAEYGGLGFPSSLEVLPNGNLQVTTYHSGEVLELVRGSGEEVRRLRIEGTVFRALRLDDGRTLVFEGERGDGESRLHLFDAAGEPVEVSAVPAGVDLEPCAPTFR